MSAPSRVLLDSAVLIYAIGGAHHYRESCRQLLQAARDGALAAETTVLALQEVMHQRSRRTGDRSRAAAVADDLAVALQVHDLERHDLRVATRLFAEVDGLDAAEACHAAIAIGRDTTTIVTPDAAFDAVPGLVRVDPATAAIQLPET